MSKTDKPVTTPAGLAAAGLIPPDELGRLEAVAARYAVSITPAMAELIDPADPADPIARQFVPDARELVTAPGESADPIGDTRHSPVPGLVHRYPDRVLLKVVGMCPVYCRFCFRREMVGPEQGAPLSEAEQSAALAYVRERPEVWEVILTGGDPFVLSPRRIAEITSALSAIPHVQVLRWHTRVPVVDPQRVSDELVAALRSTAQAVWVAVHANHPRELTPAARGACARLVDAGIPLVSQSVLLRGVNDDPDTLGALMRAFVACRIKPYYLHHGDLAPGTSHLRTTIAEGQQIVRRLRGRLSGLCQPTYVLDIPGGAGKVPIGHCHVHPSEAPGDYCLEASDGGRHSYRESVGDQEQLAKSRPLDPGSP
ncbi:MAG: lysine-2,3-aminomutase-like protein [Hyphomicrobiaceae bacterium]|nr:lysine-2,3-aminomutase-like protein [Hyphomicrobiaceae bacterium]